MSENFDVNKYWLDRGRTYIGEKRTPPEFHRLQERFLLDVLHRGNIPLGRVLELGCGFGRITKLIAKEWPTAEITALDLSVDQLANARRHCGENPRVRFGQYDFNSGAPLPGSDYDAIIAIEVFLHHPPEVILNLLTRLAAAGRHIVNLDWSEDWPWARPEHVWVHDYAKLYAQIGLRCAVFALPMKIEGKQQKVFVAARKLSTALAGLEIELRDSIQVADRLTASVESDWSVRLNQAMTDLATVVPRDSMFILVDDAQWGGLTELNGSRVIPFQERDGRYWGPPDNDETAWQELERLRHMGAHCIAFAWPSFWWLQHYREFHQQLRAQHRCVLENERLVVFSLKQ